jgi:hypothetical protein
VSTEDWAISRRCHKFWQVEMGYFLISTI